MIIKEGKRMYYRITAKLNTERALDFLQILTDGTIKSQRPDGAEIVDSMNRAVISDNGEVSFSSMCFCSTPLAHERATVYDKHFTEMKTELIDGYQSFDGRPFMDHLHALAADELKQ